MQSSLTRSLFDSGPQARPLAPPFYPLVTLNRVGLPLDHFPFFARNCASAATFS
jgi:hypothetical protein